MVFMVLPHAASRDGPASQRVARAVPHRGQWRPRAQSMSWPHQQTSVALPELTCPRVGFEMVVAEMVETLSIVLTACWLAPLPADVLTMSPHGVA